MLSEAYESFYKTFDRQMGDRSKTVGASEIGLCARQTYWYKNHATKRGVDMDPDFKHDWGARIRGTIMEFAFWVPALRYKYGNNLLYAGTEQEKLTRGYLSATPDGLIVNQPYDALRSLGIKNIKSDCFTAECKTIDPRTNLVEAKEVNVYQTQAQMGLFRIETKYKPEFAALCYTDASFWSEVDEFAIQFSPFMFKAAQQRAEQIITAKDGSKLLPEGYIRGGKECSFCPFTNACGIQRRGVPYGSRKADAQFTAEMTDAAKAYNKLKLSRDKIKENMRMMEIEIKDRLRAKKVRRIDGVVNWYEVKGATQYDNKEIRNILIAEGYLLDEYTTVGEPTDRLVVSATPTPKRLDRQSKTRKPKTGNRKTKNVKSKAGNRKR